MCMHRTEITIPGHKRSCCFLPHFGLNHAYNDRAQAEVEMAELVLGARLRFLSERAWVQIPGNILLMSNVILLYILTTWQFGKANLS